MIIHWGARYPGIRYKHKYVACQTQEKIAVLAMSDDYQREYCGQPPWAFIGEIIKNHTEAAA